MGLSNQGITFLGVGNMGAAAIQALCKASTPVTIWNRTRERRQVQAAIDSGAVFETDLAKALSQNQIVILCVLDYITITKILSSLPDPVAALGGKFIINLTNGTPKQARDMESYFRASGSSIYLDGAIMVTPQMVGGPLSFIFLSGGADDETTTGLVQITNPIGRPDYLGTDVDAAARHDLALLAPMYGMFAGGFLGMALLKRGAPSATLAPIVGGKLVPMLSPLVPLLEGIATVWDAEDWMNNEGNPIGMMLVGLQNIIEGARDEGVSGSVLEEFERLMASVVEAHGHDAGIAAVGKYMVK